MKKTALIIPCYNESKRLDFPKISSFLQEERIDLFFANDGSSDNTKDLIQAFNLQHPQRSFLIDNEVNMGKAQTIFTSVNKIYGAGNYDYIAYYDADCSTPVSEMIRLINIISDGDYSFAFASRILMLNSGIKRKKVRHFIGRTVFTIVNIKFDLGIYDTQCGAKIFSKEIIPIAFNEKFITSWLFDVEIFIRLQKQNLLKDGIEVPISNWVDVGGSKLSWKSSFSILAEIIKLYKKY